MVHLPPLQAARKRLPSGKVAHLRVRLKAVHRAGKNARVMMHDPTGGWGKRVGVVADDDDDTTLCMQARCVALSTVKCWRRWGLPSALGQ